MTPQEAVERTLALSRSDDCVVIADETSTANLRFADNTLTTNGTARDRRLTVVAIRRGASGASVGVVSRSGDITDPEDVVRAAESAARENLPAADARPLVGSADAGTGSAWDEPAAETSIGVFEGLAPALGEAFGRADAGDRRLYGYAEHSLVSTYLATSSGVRLRHDQPGGKIELNAKSADLGRSAWVGQRTRDFSDVDAALLDRGLARRLAWAERRIELPPGRYETILPPSAVADLFVYA
ncbi:MAG: TldD/PmbA family protein, partial [Streptosporangiaceae bacterium]